MSAETEYSPLESSSVLGGGSPVLEVVQGPQRNELKTLVSCLTRLSLV